MTRSRIPDGADFATLRDLLAAKGGQLLVKVLRDMLAGTASAQPQDLAPDAPNAPLLRPEDSLVDFVTMDADAIVRRHRGIAHQRPLYTFLQSGSMLQLHGLTTEESVAGVEDLSKPGMAKYHSKYKALTVRAANDSILLVSEVKQQDRVQLQAKAWWNGVRPGDRAIEGAHDGPVLFQSQ
ncbi:Methionyl-tRNA formyltransferase [Steccherinum ochraceum]|uniref:Methionyl-tRNA formyltransferase n=1 Tax=Steccherinum ochraceum TaxID=92696 RepID=A0A4V2MW79_9APHY|nr:Methionyl-tRNA formyltransferase [Steccherinum ochraceum]